MADLESTLLALSKFGKPRLVMLDRGWHCHIEMYVAAVGASFEVKSEFGHISPIAAATECEQRVVDIMRGFATGKTKAITHG